MFYSYTTEEKKLQQKYISSVLFFVLSPTQNKPTGFCVKNKIDFMYAVHDLWMQNFNRYFTSLNKKKC